MATSSLRTSQAGDTDRGFGGEAALRATQNAVLAATAAATAVMMVVVSARAGSMLGRA
jgi:hypothetical protein